MQPITFDHICVTFLNFALTSTATVSTRRRQFDWQASGSQCTGNPSKTTKIKWVNIKCVVCVQNLPPQQTWVNNRPQVAVTWLSYFLTGSITLISKGLVSQWLYDRPISLRTFGRLRRWWKTPHAPGRSWCGWAHPDRDTRDAIWGWCLSGSS